MFGPPADEDFAIFPHDAQPAGGQVADHMLPVQIRQAGTRLEGDLGRQFIQPRLYPSGSVPGEVNRLGLCHAFGIGHDHAPLIGINAHDKAPGALVDAKPQRHVLPLDFYE